MATKKNPSAPVDPVGQRSRAKEGISPTNLAPEAQQLTLDLAGETAATVRPSLLQDRLSAAERWPLTDPRGSFERLRWDVEQAGGLAQLAAACGVDRRVLADHTVLLQRRRHRQEVSRAA